VPWLKQPNIRQERTGTTEKSVLHIDQARLSISRKANPVIRSPREILKGMEAIDDGPRLPQSNRTELTDISVLPIEFVRMLMIQGVVSAAEWVTKRIILTVKYLHPPRIIGGFSSSRRHGRVLYADGQRRRCQNSANPTRHESSPHILEQRCPPPSPLRVSGPTMSMRRPCGSFACTAAPIPASRHPGIPASRHPGIQASRHPGLTA